MKFMNRQSISGNAAFVLALVFIVTCRCRAETNVFVLKEIKPTLTGYTNNAFVTTVKVGPDKKEMTVFARNKEVDGPLFVRNGGSMWGGVVDERPDVDICSGDMHVAIDGDTQFTRNFDYDGSIYTFFGTVRLLKHVFSGDEKDPLVFKLVKEEGFVYVKGKGTVTLPDGKVLTIRSPEGQATLDSDKNDKTSLAIGNWQIHLNVQVNQPGTQIQGTLYGFLSIKSDKDGKLIGTFDADDAVPVSDLTYNDGKLTFKCPLRFGDIAFGDARWDLSLRDDSLRGEATWAQGHGFAGGERMFAAFIGTWDLVFTMEGKPREETLQINRDLSAHCSLLGDISAAGITLKDNTVEASFVAEKDGKRVETKLEGTIKGNDFAGSVIFPGGNRQSCTGKKKQKI